ncbi:MAG: CotH kinase family protein [Fibrobacter sp.]|nr:CotH kinase family protein [Fibrobacter sp.]
MGKFRYIILLLGSLFLIQCVWNEPDEDSSYLPLNDSEYPYADLPRLVIETEDFRDIRNKEVEVPARLQIYGENSPESEIKNLTIRGRGNSSFEMGKYGYRLEFENKESFDGMPKNRDWALVATHCDKSFLRNYISYKLAENLKDEYAPQLRFVELYLNQEYQGLYQLTETVKVGKTRVNIPENDSSFLFERSTTETDKAFFYSSFHHLYQINSPKKPNDYSVSLLKNHINAFESFIQTDSVLNWELLQNWIDVTDFARFFLIQEFAKNQDGNRRSTFLTWQKDSVLKMGPVWDFDLTYGVHFRKKIPSNGWYMRNYGWNRFLFQSKEYRKKVREFWEEHHSTFESVIDSIDAIYPRMKKVAANEYKRWPVLEQDDQWPFSQGFDSYTDAVDSLKSWIAQRILWMDENL